MDAGTSDLGSDLYGRVYRGGLWGFIDHTGKFVLKPQFVRAKEFSEGLAAVAYGSDASMRWGYIDKSGKLRIKAKFYSAGSFRRGFSYVSVGAFGKSEAQYIDRMETRSRKLRCIGGWVWPRWRTSSQRKGGNTKA